MPSAQNRSWFSLAGLTFVYSLVLAAIMQAAHTLTRVALSLALAVASVKVLNPTAILGELAGKIGWAVFACEAAVWLSILVRRRWILLIAATAISVFAGAVIGQYLRALVEGALTRVSAFNAQGAIDLGAGALLGSKYVFVGAALAWANRIAQSGLRHYLAAGFIAAICASAITLVAMNAELIAKLGNIAVDFVFPIGCSTVVWKVRQMAEPLLRAQSETKVMLRKM